MRWSFLVFGAVGMFSAGSVSQASAEPPSRPLCPVSLSTPAPARAVVLPAAAQGLDALSGRYDEATGLWFTRRFDDDGSVMSEVGGKELKLKKRFRKGQVGIDLKAGKQSLSLSVAPGQVVIKTDRRSLSFDPSKATVAQYDAARALLRESKVVTTLRTAAASVSMNMAATAEGFDFLLTDALVALLDGDPTALVRVRERLNQQFAGVGVRSVVDENSCYTRWRRETYDAMVEQDRCINDFAIWNVPMRNLCNLDWTFRVESAWFEFLGCTAGRAFRFGR